MWLMPTILDSKDIDIKAEMNQWERLLHIQARLKRKLPKYKWNAK